MGFLDDLLKDVANGKLEQQLLQVADAVESGSQKLGDQLDAAAKKPEEVLNTAEKKADAIQIKARDITKQASRHMDIIRKKD